MTTGINNPMFVTTMRPAVAVTQYRAVNAARTAQCTVQDELIGGVAPMTIDAGTQGTIIEDGIVMWAAAGAIPAGTAVTVDINGRCVASAGGEKEQGRTREAATIVDHVIQVKLAKHGAPLAP